MKKIFFILLFLSSCGYQPLYTNQNQKNFIYEKVTLIGDKVLNRKIISALNVKEKKDSDLIDEIIFDIKKITLETSKDEKGQVASYRTSISLNLTIKNQNQRLKIEEKILIILDFYFFYIRF